LGKTKGPVERREQSETGWPKKKKTGGKEIGGKSTAGDKGRPFLGKCQ